MKKKNSAFIVFTLCLSLGLAGSYAAFVEYFNSGKFYLAQIERLEGQLEKERLEKELLTYQMKDFHQTVAQLLPHEKAALAKYEIQNLSSVLRAPASTSAIDFSGVIYERAKKKFNRAQYDHAITEFYELLEKYPISAHTVESRFFIAESYFLKKDYRNSLAQIERMVTLYPEHELTGFILLRMGQITQANHQQEEALEIYKTVMKNFEHKGLQKQARQLASSIVL